MSDTSTRGLYGKFLVRRTDGSDASGGKHEGCTYFVLDLRHDPHAMPALTAYATSCEETHPQLAADLRSVVADFGHEGEGFRGMVAQKPALDLDPPKRQA